MGAVRDGEYCGLPKEGQEEQGNGKGKGKQKNGGETEPLLGRRD